MLRLAIALVVVAGAYPVLILLQGGWFSTQGALLIGMFTVGATLFAGIPLAAWFVAKRWLKLWQACLAGLGVGIACSLPFWFTGSLAASARTAAVFAAFGAIHGAALWALGLWKNSRFSPCKSLKAVP